MKEKEFLNLLIERYTEAVSEDIPIDTAGYYLDYYLNNYPEDKYSTGITRKVAARMIHEFMVNILKWEDVDWGEARNLQDIYDCRVCSNAIAQVYTRGIIGEARPGVFGLDLVLSRDEGMDIIDRFLLAVRSAEQK